ncbi:MAG: STAS domain-containing protein [Xanthomonadales bacterium]|jgi:anti-sigma B factor antagonist|nr:STAS domain-containing protein [Xanthomonadales bacterium]
MTQILHTASGAPIFKPGFDRLDGLRAAQFKSDCIAALRGPRLLVDLSEVVFIDSSGLGALVGVLKHLGEAGEMGLVTEASGVLTLLKITRLHTIFRVFPSLTAGSAWLDSATT